MNYKQDKEEGPVKMYHLNGKLRQSGTFKNGLKEGSWLEFDENGSLLKHEKFRAGVLYETTDSH
jgi:antitoxin component YwqK of YwqJK toxin-antitoxin module